MPSANVLLVSSIYERWERGDFTSVDWAHPEIEYSLVGGPDERTYTGGVSVRETTHGRGANLFEIRDGKVVRLFLYADRDEARRAVQQG